MARPFRPREPLDMPALYLYAVGALARRMRTVAELRRLMRTRVEKGEPGEVKIEAVLTRLLAQRYLDDEAFAADYTRLRQEGAKFGRRRVQQDLQRKGVDSELVTTTLDAAYENVSEDVLARSFLERKRMKPPTNEKESAASGCRVCACDGLQNPEAVECAGTGSGCCGGDRSRSTWSERSFAR
jgi:regulatory protein